MANTQYFGTNCGFNFTTSPSSTNYNQTFKLAVPLRDVRVSYRIRQDVAESLDYSSREVFTVSTGVHELIATLRYNDDEQSLIDFLQYGVKGVPMVYSTANTTGSTAGSGAMYLIEPTGDVIDTVLDRQRGDRFGNLEVTCRFRLASGGRF